VYLGIAEPHAHLGRFALYLAFFPKLMQGPIERSRDLLPQLEKPVELSYENIRDGLLLFGYGLLKKIVVADRLATYVDPVFANVHGYSGPVFLLATYGFAFQLYYDFSGYTDMALGSAKVFGIRLTQNFDSPYLSTGIADFWRRWHISFSRWILDYIFKPLQMRWRDARTAGTIGALMITFLVSGVWHGATWGFVVWGLLHGVFLSADVLWRPYQRRVHKALRLEKTWVLRWWRIFATFNLVCLAWVFFRARSLGDAAHILTTMFRRGGSAQVQALVFAHGRASLAALIVAITITAVAGWVSRPRRGRQALIESHSSARWALAYLIVLGVVFFRASSGTFIYFQF
jgi:alginate O-acetyltransferase complex protein AlgI